MVRSILAKMFVCQCKTMYGVKHVHQFGDGNKIVGKCLKCNKRVYGRIYNNLNEVKEKEGKQNEWRRNKTISIKDS